MAFSDVGERMRVVGRSCLHIFGKKDEIYQSETLSNQHRCSCLVLNFITLRQRTSYVDLVLAENFG
jgi:hypothetical protein